jgi:hypothetical protein
LFERDVKLLSDKERFKFRDAGLGLLGASQEADTTNRMGFLLSEPKKIPVLGLQRVVLGFEEVKAFTTSTYRFRMTIDALMVLNDRRGSLQGEARHGRGASKGSGKRMKLMRNNPMEMATKKSP